MNPLGYKNGKHPYKKEDPEKIKALGKKTKTQKTGCFSNLLNQFTIKIILLTHLILHVMWDPQHELECATYYYSNPWNPKRRVLIQEWNKYQN